MKTGQCARVLKALPALMIASLVISACTSNSSSSIPVNNQWFRCQASSTGNIWDCNEGNPGETGQVQNPAKAPEPAPGEEMSFISTEPKPEQEATVQTDLKAEYDEAFTAPENTGPPVSADANYSVQIAAFTDRGRRDTYILESPVDRADLILSQGLRSGKTWWLVLYGSYHDYAEALEAQSHLAENYGLTETWIKPLD